ncbi:hypothetical protein CsSME_00050587 [Camellia sinensis var. sinensis]
MTSQFYRFDPTVEPVTRSPGLFSGSLTSPILKTLFLGLELSLSTTPQIIHGQRISKAHFQSPLPPFAATLLETTAIVAVAPPNHRPSKPLTFDFHPQSLSEKLRVRLLKSRWPRTRAAEAE